MRKLSFLFAILVAGMLALIAAQPALACHSSAQPAAPAPAAVPTQQSWASISLGLDRTIASSDPALLDNAWASLSISAPDHPGIGYPIVRQSYYADGTLAEKAVYYPDQDGFDGMVYLITKSDSRLYGNRDQAGSWYTSSLELDRAMHRLIDNPASAQLPLFVAPPLVTTPAPQQVTPPVVTTEPQTTAPADSDSLDFGEVLIALVALCGGGLVLYLLLRVRAVEPAIRSDRPASSEDNSEE